MASSRPHDAEALTVPRFAPRDVPDDFEMVLRRHDGRDLLIEGVPITSTAMSIVPQNDLHHGISRDDDLYSCTMSPSRIRLDGVDGVGHRELSMLNQLVVG
ncbi:hypothetical protein [Frankia sp. Cr1]|uniref:hypothetical protein n=1 Tax=Frankia sp. Cr1 TaxID=3073931 RepID=UPI002AD2C35C|nr:hypothetical protein [Frankia sp. Cr1]